MLQINDVKKRVGRPPNSQRKNKTLTKTRFSKRISNVNGEGQESANRNTEIVDHSVYPPAEALNKSTPRGKKDSLVNLKTTLSPKFIGLASETLNSAGHKKVQNNSLENLNSSLEVIPVPIDKTDHSMEHQATKMEYFESHPGGGPQETTKFYSTMEANNNNESLQTFENGNDANLDLDTVIPSNIIEGPFRKRNRKKEKNIAEQKGEELNTFSDECKSLKNETNSPPQNEVRTCVVLLKSVTKKNQTVTADRNALSDICKRLDNEINTSSEYEINNNAEMMEGVVPLSDIEIPSQIETPVIKNQIALSDILNKERNSSVEYEMNNNTEAFVAVVPLRDIKVPNHVATKVNINQSVLSDILDNEENTSPENQIVNNTELMEASSDVSHLKHRKINISSELKPLSNSTLDDEESDKTEDERTNNGETFYTDQNELPDGQIDLKLEVTSKHIFSLRSQNSSVINKNSQYVKSASTLKTKKFDVTDRSKKKMKRELISPPLTEDISVASNDNNENTDYEESIHDFQSTKNEHINFGRNSNEGIGITAKSPSDMSIDSAKGSSINNEMGWMSILTGDLYWGQIHSYCYWPCMVCPDPDGKLILTSEVEGDTDQIHVRFFGNNIKRSWVRRENLIPFSGLENYQQRVQEIEEKYGKKTSKYKLLLPNQSNKRKWLLAVREANEVHEEIYPERLKKFYSIFERSRGFPKFVRKRRKSMVTDSSSSLGENSGKNMREHPVHAKREREYTASPISPAYSPVKSLLPKRRKLNTVDETSGSLMYRDECDNMIVPSSAVTNAQADGSVFEDPEFTSLLEAIKDYVMEQDEPEDEPFEESILSAVRNIWGLKVIRQSRLVNHNKSNLNSTLVVNARLDAPFKRLSTRIKNIKALSTFTPTTEVSVKKPILNSQSNLRKKTINRPIEEVIDDIFNLDSKYLFRGVGRECVCKYCYQPGLNLIKCSKSCYSWLHIECNVPTRNHHKKPNTRLDKNVKEIKKSINVTEPSTSVVNSTEGLDANRKMLEQPEPIIPESDIVCMECLINPGPNCFVCGLGNEPDPLIICKYSRCSKAFHPKCCKYWPQSQITKSNNTIESFRCPSHVCHTCVFDDPKGKFQEIRYTKLVRCIKCPATYHTDSTCVPAGSQILSTTEIICPRHSDNKSGTVVNANWCFICVGGGHLLCCETCPTSVHVRCLKIDPPSSQEPYICEFCESGRLPLYGEMVWAKFNAFRWWPSIILPPTEVPKNIERKPHNASEFVVRFFGSHDHAWIPRKRVYLYMEGDTSEPPKSKSNLDTVYKRGVEEAKVFFQVIKEKKQSQVLVNEKKDKLAPPPYVRIKSNRAVPPVRLITDMQKVSKCECNPYSENPCGPDTNCLNRELYSECNPKLCPAGERCQNQMFESKVSPSLEVVHVKERGWGLVCREAISAGTFVIEYVGEVITGEEYQRRCAQKSMDRDENFYFLAVDKDFFLDAGPKGNEGRFMNHSCDPNCMMQKWIVNGLNRMGLFAIKDIEPNTELTFDYRWEELMGNGKKVCYCGTAKCSGQIGGKKQNEMEIPNKDKAAKKPKTVNRVQKTRPRKNKEIEIKLAP